MAVVLQLLETNRVLAVAVVLAQLETTALELLEVLVALVVHLLSRVRL
jgi:hypothetical protein